MRAWRQPHNQLPKRPATGAKISSDSFFVSSISLPQESEPSIYFQLARNESARKAMMMLLQGGQWHDCAPTRTAYMITLHPEVIIDCIISLTAKSGTEAGENFEATMIITISKGNSLRSPSSGWHDSLTCKALSSLRSRAIGRLPYQDQSTNGPTEPAPPKIMSATIRESNDT